MDARLARVAGEFLGQAFEPAPPGRGIKEGQQRGQDRRDGPPDPQARPRRPQLARDLLRLGQDLGQLSRGAGELAGHAQQAQEDGEPVVEVVDLFHFRVHALSVAPFG